MDQDVIDSLYSTLVPSCKWLYLSNPIGKYLPETAGLTRVDPNLVKTVMALGRSKSVIEPWDSITLDPARSQHIEVYLPHNFDTSATSPSRLRPHYQHVLYQSSTK
jgi:hypothetical protein